jgi:hypothetical protein
MRLLIAICGSLLAIPTLAAEPRLSIEPSADALAIRADGRPIAQYVLRHDKVLRPFFTDLHAPNGVQVTRNFPPVAGKDAPDHDTMHPGLWLGFGDISGADFWRNKGVVRHVEFVEPPRVEHNSATFAVRNVYQSGDNQICEQVCHVAISARPAGYWILLDSRFTSPREFAFGDQEELGLGLRVATPLAVKNGGRLTNSDGLSGEKQLWGKQADWCDYSGEIDGQAVGVLLVPDPANFRRSWFHARDYGFVAANPFGRNAFTKGEKSHVVVLPGQSLSLRYAVLVHAGQTDLAQDYREALELMNAMRP